MDEIKVLVNGELLTIRAPIELINYFKIDDEFLMQYVSEEINKRPGPSSDDGCLNIQRIDQDHQLSEDTDVQEEPGTSGTNKEVWMSKGKSSEEDIEATYLLLELRASEKFSARFDDKKTVKMSLWHEIAENLTDRGFCVDGEKCRQKFLNLTKKYVAFVRHSLRTGNNKVSEPPFYELLHKILGEKDKIVLGNVKDTLHITEPDATSVAAESNLPETLDISNSKENDNTNDEQDNNHLENIKISKSKMQVTKMDILNAIVKSNDNILKAQDENAKKIHAVLLEHNQILRVQNEQRDKLIKIMENMVTSKKSRKRKRSSTDSD